MQPSPFSIEASAYQIARIEHDRITGILTNKKIITTEALPTQNMPMQPSNTPLYPDPIPPNCYHTYKQRIESSLRISTHTRLTLRISDCAGRLTTFSIFVSASFLMVSIMVSVSSSSCIWSPPPMLLPMTITLGTVRLPVVSARTSCSLRPRGCSSSSTT